MDTLKLNFGSPIPLYHQIAEILRFRIARGLLRQHEPLPSLVQAAKAWGVNIHTIRRGYQELEKLGLVETKVPRGTIVLGQSPNAPPGQDHQDELREFVSQFISDAERRFHVQGHDLARILAEEIAASANKRSPTVYVAECSRHHRTDLANQVMDQWQVEALQWPISRKAPPPQGPILSTYFHLTEIRRRWARALERIHLLPLYPAAGLLDQVRRALREHPQIQGILVCEREEMMLQNIMIDVISLMANENLTIEPVLVKRDMSRWLDKKPHTMLALLSPRLWGDLPEGYREKSDIIGVDYRFDSPALELLGRRLGWRRQQKHDLASTA